jgi:predicted nucleic acid-binding protein
LSGYVLDASVAAKWLLDHEPYAQEAKSLLRSHASGRISFTAPDFFWLEIGNVFWKAVRQQRISKDVAEDYLVELASSVSIPTVSSVILREDALLIALTYNRSVYDSSYLALALTSGLPMITADERLVRALGARFPIHWIGALASA